MGGAGRSRRKLSLRGVDRRLHFLFGHVNVQTEVELQSYD